MAIDKKLHIDEMFLIQYYDSVSENQFLGEQNKINYLT